MTVLAESSVQWLGTTMASARDTLKLLARLRAEVRSTEPLPFGVWGEVAVPGRVRVGDTVVAGA